MRGSGTSSRYIPRFFAAAARKFEKPSRACSNERREAGGSASRSIALYMAARAASYRRKGSADSVIPGRRRAGGQGGRAETASLGWCFERETRGVVFVFVEVQVYQSLFREHI